MTWGQVDKGTNLKTTDDLPEGSTNLYDSLAEKKALTGFRDDQRSHSKISWSDSTKILTLTHLSDYTVFVDGTEIEITSTLTKDISASIAEGWWYFYIDSSGALQAASTFPTFKTSALVTFFYWDATNAKRLFPSEERHGTIQDYITHNILHHQIGTRWKSGLTITSNVISGAPADDTSSKCYISDGVIADEDLDISIVGSATPTNDFEQILGSNLIADAAKLPVYYLDGSAGNIRRWDNDVNRYAFKHASGNTPPEWNEYTGGAWTMSAVGNKEFAVYWLCASNLQLNPVFLIPHTSKFSSISAAKKLTVADFPKDEYNFPEVTILERRIYKYRTTFTSATHRCALRQALNLKNTTVPSVISSPSFDTGAANAWAASRIDTHDHGRLARNSTTQVQIEAVSDTHNFVFVNGERVSLASAIVCNTGDYLVAADGSDSGVAVSASTKYYAYLSNSIVSPFFAPLDLRLSVTAPTNGYLGEDGDAENWRYVGLVYTNSSSQFTDFSTVRDVETVPIFPEKITCWGEEGKNLSGDTPLLNLNTSQNYSTFALRSIYADGDSAGRDIFLKAGTYTFGELCAKGTADGILDWYLDDTKIVAGSDHYSAAFTYNVVFGTYSIVVSRSGKYRLKYVVNGKNAASTDYRILFTKAWLERTA